MKILCIGGSGIISNACTHEALAQSMQVYHLNRGITNAIRPTPPTVVQLTADIRNTNEVASIIQNMHFDAVIDFISFEPEHIEQNIKLFAHKTSQYFFISSASAYQTPPEKLPVTERTPLCNPIWQYSRNKIACETLLRNAYKTQNFPAIIIRPSHTYDHTLLPIEGGYTVLHRMMQNKPIVIHGDGSSLWTLTHAKDFAKGLIGLIGNTNAIGEDFHITSDEYLSWNAIYTIIAQELNVDLQPVYVPSQSIAKYNKQIGDSLLGDKTHSMIFDTRKIKQFVPNFTCTIPFSAGAKEIIAWHTSNLHTLHVDTQLDAQFESIIEKFRQL